MSKNLEKGDCIWVSSFTYHGFTGQGSLLKISDGQKNTDKLVATNPSYKLQILVNK